MALISAIFGYGVHADRPTDNSAGTEGRFYYETDNLKMYRDNGSSWDLLDLVSTAAAPDYILLHDEKGAGTNGGTFSSGAWQKRDINTVSSDTGGHASLASNQITLDAGTYRMQIRCPALTCGSHQARLYDTTAAAVIKYGSSGYAGRPSDDILDYSVITGQFTLSVESVLEIQHQCYVTKADYGLGVAANFGGAETYTIAEFWKIA